MLAEECAHLVLLANVCLNSVGCAIAVLNNYLYVRLRGAACLSDSALMHDKHRLK